MRKQEAKMKTTHIFFSTFGVLLFVIACGEGSNSNTVSPQSRNSTCVEGAQTTLNGVNYVCRNDQLIAIQDTTQICTVGSTMQDTQGYSYTCENNNWILSQPQSSSYDSNSHFFSSSSSITNLFSSSSPTEASSSESIYCHYLTKNSKCILQSTEFSKVTNISGKSIYNKASKTLKDLRDNQVYKTVTIGEQVWMAENLKLDYDYGSAKSFCYNYIADSCASLGHLYTYSAAIDSAGIYSSKTAGCGTGIAKCVVPAGLDTAKIRGICPEGWRIPNTNDWIDLIMFAGDGTDGYVKGATALKSKTGWKDNGNGSDKFGFNVKPSGFKFSFDDYSFFEPFDHYGEYAYFWTTYRQTKYNTEVAIFSAKDMSQTSEAYFNFDVTMTDNKAASLRCIKNND